MSPYYELEHKRENRYITRPDFRSARADFARQWRDQDGSIPWRMFEVSPLFQFGEGSRTEVDPWTGFAIATDKED